jgi:hypothetical protein
MSRGRTRVCLVAIALLAPGAAAAQTGTSEGARALVRGDYETAVRILRPLAENAGQPDPLAQFLLAMLYESGHHGDPLRACGLYLAAAAATNPLATQSLVLGRAIQDRVGRLGRLCNERSAIDAPPLASTSFTLGPDHRITMDSDGATVEYHGSQKRTPMSLGGPLVYLPLRYTPLNVSQPSEMTRHFIQVFAWMPNPAADQVTWGLSGMVFEVVGADVFAVAGSGFVNVLKITAPQPPAAFDVATAVQLLVGTNGEAEWLFLTDPPRRGVIPFRKQE